MRILSRWLVPTVLAAGLGFAAMAPAPVQAQDSLSRVLVDIADVVFNNGTPYYRNDNGYNAPLIVGRDRYGRPVYYRQVPSDYGRVVYDQYGRRIVYSGRDVDRSGPPYGNAYGYYRNGPGSNRVKCNKHGKCKTSYYDPRYNRQDYNRDRDDRHEHDDDDD